VLVTALCLVAWRALDQIPITEINRGALSLFATLQSQHTSGLFHAIGSSAVPFASYSLGAIGIAPYIYALVFVSLVPVRSLRRWTRALAVALSLVQAYGLTLLMQSTVPALIEPEWFPRLVVCLELASGTVIALLLADLIDEYGLGFGYAALILFALQPFAGQVHRLADYAALPWGLTIFFKAGALWALISVGIVIATVAVVRAVRPVSAPMEEKSGEHRETELTLFPSGVLRPPLIAGVIVSLPLLSSGYLFSSHPPAARWIFDVWSPYSPNPWRLVLYLVIASCVVVALAVLIARMEHPRSEIPDHVRRHITRLAFIGGCFLALTVEVVPVLARLITTAAGQAIELSGFAVVFTTVVILATLTAAQGGPGERRIVGSPELSRTP
jgi:preprotein translocase subunit SecY